MPSFGADRLRDPYRQPKQGDLLVTIRRILESMNYKTLEQIKDKTNRTYAVKMQCPTTGLPFMLVVKGSAIMKDIVSTQEELVKTWHGPVVLAWKRQNDDAVAFYVFDPEQILLHTAFLNERFGVKMVNFKLDLGRPWKIGEQGLDEVWTKMKKKRNEVITSFLEVQTT